MTTPSTKYHPSITWQKKELLERNGRMEVYSAEGVDEYGSEYEGEAVYVGGELEEIKLIELV